MEPIIRIHNLSRRYGKTLALDGIDFEAGRGKVYGLVGANGAGKTTFIKHILGLLRAQQGQVSVFGLDPVKQTREVLKGVGYLSENRDLPDWMSIQELMRYTSAFHANWDQGFCDELLNRFELDPAQKIGQLSRGMRAQTGLVAAVAHRPQLLVLDEPSSGLDVVVRNDILNAVVRTISDQGSTVLFSSHLLDEVERMSDHVTMIQKGQILLDGDLEALCDAHRLCEFKFTTALQKPPALPVVLLEGENRSWRALHKQSDAQFAADIEAIDGQVLQTRRASLEEIFLAYAGHGNREELAA
jgi:ABC-2 type transport system ATP-binding protein